MPRREEKLKPIKTEPYVVIPEEERQSLILIEPEEPQVAPKLVQEHVIEVQPEVQVAERHYNPQEIIGMGLGAGILALGIPLAGYLGYKVIRKFGENVFGEDKNVKK